MAYIRTYVADRMARPGRLDRLPTVLARVALGVGGVQLLLWVVAPQALRPMLLGAEPTHPSTAVALVALSAALGLPGSRAVRAALLALTSVLVLEGLVAVALGRPLLAAGPVHPVAWTAVVADERMALSSALVLLALIHAVVLSHRRPRLVTGIAAGAFLLAFAGVVGHLYGVGSLTTMETATAMAAPTAVATLLLSASVLIGAPRLPVARALRAPGPAGALVRQYLGAALVVPPVVGWAVVTGEEAGWFDPAYGQSLMVLVLTGGTTAAVVLGARTVSRVERGRTAVEDRERLQFVLDCTPVGIFESDPSGRRTYVNLRWRELTGVAHEVAGSDWLDVVHPEDRGRVGAEWAAALAGGQDWVGRYRYAHPDGTVVWVDSRTTAVKDDDGTVLKWLGTVTDVTDQVEARSRLEESELRYRSVVDTMAEGVVMQAPDGRIITANNAASRLLGLSPDELLGVSSVDPRWRAVHEDGSDFPGSEHPAMVALSMGRPVRDVTMGVHRPDSALVWLEVASEPLLEEQPDGTSRVIAAVTTFSDVTEARRASRALARSEEQFRSAMAHAPVGMALVALDGTFREVNRSLCRLVGYDESDLLGRTFQQITHPEDLDADLDKLSRLTAGAIDHYTMEKRYLTRAGEIVWVLLAVSMVRDDDQRPSHYVAQIQDITASRAAQQRLAHRALHDPLTGLANRDLLMDRLAHSLSRSSRSGAPTVVLFCDLDRFKEVNDTHGHETGDLVLVTVADRLRQVVRPSDTVARLGGDEFVVVAEGVVSDVDQRALADRVRETLAQPVQVAGVTLRTGASIGVAVARPEDDARSLLREADAAMYRAKARGRGRYEVSTPAADERGPVASAVT